MNGAEVVTPHSYCVTATGQIFNDAYRYMDWLLTVPLLLVELILVMNLPEKETTATAWKLGGAAALMIVLGCKDLDTTFTRNPHL